MYDVNMVGGLLPLAANKSCAQDIEEEANVL